MNSTKCCRRELVCASRKSGVEAWAAASRGCQVERSKTSRRRRGLGSGYAWASDQFGNCPDAAVGRRCCGQNTPSHRRRPSSQTPFRGMRLERHADFCAASRSRCTHCLSRSPPSPMRGGACDRTLTRRMPCELSYGGPLCPTPCPAHAIPHHALGMARWSSAASRSRAPAV